MKSFLQELFVYTHDCHQQLIGAFHTYADRVSPRAVEIWNHILNAHHVWNHRIMGEKPMFQIWELHDPQAYAAIENENFQLTLQILEARNLHEVIAYQTTKGDAFENTVQDILFHVINHATYHRGQIAMEFRRSGIEPLVSDYILYKRR
ncbi:DinB family protein [Thermoflavifilum thermophilum]|uniref:Uncharacterized damage-inducible protein DinB (Forms a four-helix bundle) n=1 Tax=Thermoflavifilum thermophilum TaxID=1393122 RepID=A0A1I7MXV7_9BACT|nr:DinB family protein [Thermoflavifilum thermophilum]SFV27198.1 Uncharacterized damage-inducible protein DinB (forms a four-helix bundle) [Thermoflavifilum thermophilum]